MRRTLTPKQAFMIWQRTNDVSKEACDFDDWTEEKGESDGRGFAFYAGFVAGLRQPVPSIKLKERTWKSH